jgi:hypothetical protein
MAPYTGELSDLVEIGAGLQDRSLGRVGLGLAGLALPFVGAPALRKLFKGRKKVPSVRAVSGESNIYIDPSDGKKIHVDPITGEITDYMNPMLVMNRRREQGYRGLFHGTEDVKDLETGLYGPFYQTDNPRVARGYAGGAEYGVVPPEAGVVKSYSRSPNQLVFDAEGSSYQNIPVEKVRPSIDPSRLEEFDRLVKATGRYGYGPPRLSTSDLEEIAGEMGYSGFDAYNLLDRAGKGLDKKDIPSLVRATLDPGLVRLEGAKFDPSKLGVPDLFAGIAGLTGARYMSNALREDRSN